MTRPSPICRSASRVVLAVSAMAAFAAAAAAEMRDITLPIRPDAAYMRQAIVSQVFTGENETAPVWNDGNGCNFLVLSNPRVRTSDGLVRLLSFAEARVGTRLGSRCIVITDWSGTIETAQTVELEPGGNALRFNVVDSEIREETTHSGVSMGVVWDWIKTYVHPRLGEVRIDLAPALEDLKGVLRLVLQANDRGMSASIETITPRSVEVVDGGLLVGLGMQVPRAGKQPAPPAESLTPAELARFEAAWKGWDGFVTFVVKHFAASTAAPGLRQELLEVLIEARYDLIGILTAEPGHRGVDPVRVLFMDTWNRLAPVLREMSPDMPRERALNLLSFITAADALQALDDLGPGFGVDISLDGLRRMARILAPDAREDPLQYDEQVDPELRELFDFGPPLRRRDLGPAPQSWWHGIIPDARAAIAVDDALVERLNSWVPPRAELEPYLESVHRLLDETSRGVATDSELDSDLHEMYRALVLATAWQETCWRQFKQVDGQITPIRSAAGAVGMMQIMPNVWRGFYESGGLTSDIAYNAAAGSEILMHYLLNYAIRHGEDKQSGGPDNLARATYAAYNGGPGHLRRYRAADTGDALRKIDLAFEEKYQTIRNGDELAVRACYTS
ncbi:MAG: lytic transglycosylase domain-containing protein [Gammaproteobacteria bacterium]|nr:lytic transglycosylase domain-containing protein [Gammaproteobacteria bacterium]